MDANPSVTSGISRRKALAGCGTALTGGLVAALGLTGRTRAAVEMDTLSIAGDSATLAEPPSAIMVQVSGEYQIDGPTTPDQARTVLQLEIAGASDDLDEAIFMDAPTGGSYTLQADAFSHRNLERGDLLPTATGETRSVDVTVRVILLAVSDGSIMAESHIEKTAQVELTKDGLQMSLGGSGDIQVQPA